MGLVNAPVKLASGARLLLIEADDAVRRGLQLLLTGQGYQVHAFSRAVLALADPAVIAASHLIIGYALPESDGIQALRSLQSHGWRGRAVLVTALTSRKLGEAALNAGFAAVLSKPFSDADLLDALRGAPASG